MAKLNPAEALEYFRLPPGKRKLHQVSDGFINDTYRVSLPGTDGYILQRINTEVFPDPRPLMQNLEEVLPRLGGAGYRTLELVPARDGKSWLQDPILGAWRLYKFIPGSQTFSVAARPGIAREAGRILGRFHQLLQGANPGKLQPTLPGFHDLALRMEQLRAAETAGQAGRIARGRELSARAWELEALLAEVPLAALPERICHNDPKLSNILFSQDQPPQALCLIDLDTLMPGLLIFDFGDAARSLVHDLPEDHPGKGECKFDLEAYRAFCMGFAAHSPDLTPAEIASLPHGVLLMALLHGVRALADYFLGDRYYKTTYPDQNLVRAGNLLAVAAEAGENLVELQNIWKAACDEAENLT